MEKINSIRLEDVLPRVFVNESIPQSQVWKCSLSFNRGTSYLVEATSGGGKSSMCAYIFGSRTDYEGTIFFNDTDIRDLTTEQWQRLRRKNIAYLPQELALFPELSALENIMLKNRLTDFFTETEILNHLKDLGIDNRSDYPVGKMSIGQQQRVAIIRAVCQPFDFILLDEPVSHLDAANNAIAARIIGEAAKKQNAAIITTSVGNHLSVADALHLKL